MSQNAVYTLLINWLQGLYDEKFSSMDELGGFEPTDTTGFIQIESIRIKKYVHALPAFSFKR